MYMLNPDLLQLNPIHFQNSQWARAPQKRLGPGPRRLGGPGPMSFVGGPGPGPFDYLFLYKPRHLGFFEKVNSIDLEEIGAEQYE